MKSLNYLLILFVFVISGCATKPTPGSLSPAAVGWNKIDRGALVIDVRGAAQFENAHIDGAVNIPHDQIMANIGDVERNQSREIVLYCRSGRRAAMAEQVLRELGYTNVHVAGGYDDLARERGS